MNPNESTKETEFVFRRLGESFTQFASDLWASVPLWLLILTAVVMIGKIGYTRYVRRVRGPGKPDAAQYWLWWAAFLSIATLVVWILVALYQRDAEQVKAGSAPLSALGESNKAMWYSFVIGLFSLGSLFTILMYIKDSKSIRWFWAVKLAILRITVYAILCFVFLLPAKQTWERTEKKSRVVVLLDISPSMTRVSDEIDSQNRKAKTRMDVLIEFLTDDKVKLIKPILEQNPVVVYQFGTRLDESPRTMNRGEAALSKGEWEEVAAYDFRAFLLKGLSEPGREALRNTTIPVNWNGPTIPPDQKKLEATNWAEWASAWYGYAKQNQADDKNWKPLVTGMSQEDDTLLRDNINKLDRRIDVARTIALGTNVPDSVTAAVNRESAHMVQGVIVFSDGRSNLGSDSSYRELRERASKEKIPIFTIMVGEERQITSINISDIQADETAQPDQGFKANVDIDGINLAGKTVDVELDVFYLGPDGKGPDGKPIELKDAKPDFTFNERTNPKKAPYQVTFAQGDPPHAQIEFEIDPVKLSRFPEGEKITKDSTDAAIKKRVLLEGKWAVRARVPKHAEELLEQAEHVRERMGIQVLQKKLRVLLVAGAPSREFQFLRTFLVREVLDNRATVTILVQNEAGTSGNLTPNPTEEVIGRFPNKLDLTNTKIDPKEKAYNLNEYDLIVAFDPDWSEVTRQQAEDLQTWVQRQGGGLIYVADRINTFQLIRQGTEMGSQLNPILDILPVVPDDVIAVKITAIARNPRRLYLKPVIGSDLLKLDETPGDKADGPDKNDPIAGWERYFTDRDKYVKQEDKVEFFPHRGFYSCYPVKEVKAGAHVLAEFATIDERGEKTLRPWLVTNSPSAAWRTCFMGSGEVYRMYSYDKEYYERFWGKLMKYMAAKRNVKLTRGRVLVSKEYVSGTPIRVQAQILNPTSRPYPFEGAGAIDPKFSIWKVSSTGEKPIQIEGAIPMVAKVGASEFDGYYVGNITADPKKFPPGDDYFVEIDVPESSDKLQGKFTITKSDPEMDNSKPNFQAMLAMASDFDGAFQDRIPNSVKEVFKHDLAKDSGVQKLFFKITDTELIKLIPQCFKSDYQRFDIRGPVTDLWDRGVEFPNRKDDGDFAERNVPEFLAGKSLPVSWVMLVVISLLCWEWLTRKLLRLA